MSVKAHVELNLHVLFVIESQVSQNRICDVTVFKWFSAHCLLQYVTATFEAGVEVAAQSQVKGRNLTFEVVGEGNLPRISILKPIVRNKKGQSLLLFKRNLIGKEQTLPLHLVNDGTLPSKVKYDHVYHI